MQRSIEWSWWDEMGGILVGRNPRRKVLNILWTEGARREMEEGSKVTLEEVEEKAEEKAEEMVNICSLHIYRLLVQ